MGSRVYDNDTSVSIVNDSRIGVADQATYIGDGSSVSTTINQTDGGAFDFSTGVVNAAVEASNRAVMIAGQAASDAARAAQQAAEGAILAQRQTADSAINAIRATGADAIALARSTNDDAFLFAADVSDGFLTASHELNAIVGNLATSNQAFTKGVLDEALQRAQSSDQQNYEKTLDFMKKVGLYAAVVIAVVVVVPRFAKGAK